MHAPLPCGVCGPVADHQQALPHLPGGHRGAPQGLWPGHLMMPLLPPLFFCQPCLLPCRTTAGREWPCTPPPPPSSSPYFLPPFFFTAPSLKRVLFFLLLWPRGFPFFPSFPWFPLCLPLYLSNMLCSQC